METGDRFPWSIAAQDSGSRGIRRSLTHHEVTHPQVSLLLPTINIACNFCKGVLPPHNSGYKNQLKPVFEEVLRDGPPVIQVFLLPYMCQTCKQEPIFFLVRRKGLKLTLTGRSHLMKVDVPSSIPTQEAAHFGDAMIANTAGKTLAGLFWLRVFVEQYMRRVTKSEGKMRGEELGDKYAAFSTMNFQRSSGR